MGGRAPSSSNNDSNNKSDKFENGQDQKQVPTGYVHVRARRGQATDSHSLAERVSQL